MQQGGRLRPPTFLGSLSLPSRFSSALWLMNQSRARLTLSLQSRQLARNVRQMADKSFGSESLAQALHFLGDKSVLGKSARNKESQREPIGVSAGAIKGAKKMRTGRVFKTPFRGGQVFLDLSPSAIDRLADKLDVAEVVILSVSGISERTFHRRQKQGEPLTSDEADRVLRIARVAGAAERVFGDAEKSRRWLGRENALLGATPLSLLATDAGSRDVEAELMRIDWGDFA